MTIVLWLIAFGIVFYGLRFMWRVWLICRYRVAHQRAIQTKRLQPTTRNPAKPSRRGYRATNRPPLPWSNPTGPSSMDPWPEHEEED